MLKTMTPDPDEPSSINPATNDGGNGKHQNNTTKENFLTRLKHLVVKPRNGSDTLREALEEYIEELDEDITSPSIANHERALISNVLKLRDTTVIDVMIPRADIAAIEVNATKETLMELLAE